MPYTASTSDSLAINAATNAAANATTSVIMDIVPPAMPVDSISLAGGILITITVVVSALLVIRYLVIRYRYPAMQTLSSVHNAWTGNRTDNRATAFQLAAALRDGLSLNRLSHTTPLPDNLQQHQDRWQSFIQLLDKARYSAAPCSIETLRQLFSDARFWLQRWPH